MAIIESVNDLYNRVRTILDKGDTPWMSNEEIDDFISMAGSEFTQERVDKFGATQRLRDDLGAFVRTIVFFDSANTSLGGTITSLANGTINNETPVYWLDWFNSYVDSFIGGPQDFGFEIWPISYNVNPISTISCDLTFSGTYYVNTDETISNFTGEPLEWQPGLVAGKPNVNTIIGSKLIYLDQMSALDPSVDISFLTPKTQAIKIISINDYEGSLEDPFNRPTSSNVRAVRTGNLYHILPYLTLTKVNEYGFIVFDYVSGSCTSSNIVNYMPKSSVEEICQIAARKILGTTADERYTVGNNEINQLNI